VSEDVSEGEKIFRQLIGSATTSEHVRTARAGFVNSVDSHYLESYIFDHFSSLLANEHKNVYKDHFDWSRGELLRLGTIYDRAMSVDKLFSHASIPELKMIDKGIIFNAVNNLDKWICAKRELLC
jgi:hypothetical protein